MKKDDRMQQRQIALELRIRILNMQHSFLQLSNERKKTATPNSQKFLRLKLCETFYKSQVKNGNVSKSCNSDTEDNMALQVEETQFRLYLVNKQTKELIWRIAKYWYINIFGHLIFAIFLKAN